jgi:transposase InsO family protein
MAKEEKVSERTVCLLLGITPKTLQNWRKTGLKDRRKGSNRYVSHRLSEAEKQALYDQSISERFKDRTPAEIIATLSYENNYIASESSLYRILREKGALAHRRESKKPRKSTPHIPFIVTGPNQVWAWDITWLRTTVRGIFKYAYSIIDLFDRTLVGWIIEDNESDDHAKKLFTHVIRDQKVVPQIVHADNGNPMRGACLASFLDGLLVSRSYSRPRVSDDNAFIESWHKTLKNTVGYPKAFDSLSDARTWFADFVNWYNNCHMHSGLGYVTPQQRRSGEAEEIYQKRDEGLQAAKLRNPSRWRKGKTKVWSSLPVSFGYRPVKAAA